MQHELTIGDLDTPVDPAGTLDVSRVSISVVKTVIQVAGDIVISTINHVFN